MTPLIVVWALIAPVQEKTGGIKGRVSPEVPVRVVAKLAGKDASKKENVLGEALLPKGGAFSLLELPPGKYDLLFQLQGEHAKKYVASNWSEIVVEPGKAVEGIHYRLTPADAAHEVDAVTLSFEASMSDAECVKAIAALDCRVKRRAPKGSRYTVDIPDDKTVPEMIAAFKAVKGVELAEPNGISRLK